MQQKTKIKIVNLTKKEIKPVKQVLSLFVIRTSLISVHKVSSKYNPPNGIAIRMAHDIASTKVG